MPKKGGKQSTIAARSERHARYIAMRDEREKAGVCLRCGSNRDSKWKHCSKCREGLKRYETKRRNRQGPALRRFGICRYCKTEDVLPGQRACKVCHEKHRQCGIRVRIKRKEQGLCPECGSQVKTGVCCEACKAKARERWHARKHQASLNSNSHSRSMPQGFRPLKVS